MPDSFVPLDPDGQLGYLMVRAADHVARPWQAALREHGINPRQFSTLALLAREPDMSQGELARRVLVTPQSMSESLRGLVASGLISRDDGGPGKAAVLRLTDKGRGLLSRAYPVVTAAGDVPFEHLTAAERATLAALLKKVLG
ncbi:MarR family winged helix-turn-helix transcriptional regulator [Pseudonocardia sp. WMMC193]|uniref:MarR family winged helix-turn-helix transcriptional regulator n=1 Tax=Pseudonocardia sp. WMMC193 TaxID=2911965 RepID=UPI001F0200EF|nr:MarR family transcriptional regulator [Pseudonocardia sp. WMMC193]MCF7548560.1 MarR family transcriptional regulator [Pseudonocardia sp. WMMC193]